MCCHLLLRSIHYRITLAPFKWSFTATRYRRCFGQIPQPAFQAVNRPPLQRKVVDEEGNASGSTFPEAVEQKTNVDRADECSEMRAPERRESRRIIKAIRFDERTAEEENEEKKYQTAKEKNDLNLWQGQKLLVTEVKTEPTRYRSMQRLLHPYFSNFPRKVWSMDHRECLPLGHHFIYITDQDDLMETQLSHDGYDASQSPGRQFPRRLWSRGSILIPEGAALELDSRVISIVPTVKEVCVTGTGHDEIIAVEFERNIYASDRQLNPAPLLTENRTLVYMKQPFVSPTISNLRRIKMSMTPDFSHEVRITPITLFRYSALTYNAHRIHYDTGYSRSEGYEGLLVHGPLQVTFILELLRVHLLMTRHSEVAPNVKWKIESFEYKCLAPLYADQAAKLCIKLLNEQGMRASYQLWIEGEFGEVYMRGRAQVAGRDYRFSENTHYVEESRVLGDAIYTYHPYAIDGEAESIKATRGKAYRELEEEYNDFRTCY